MIISSRVAGTITRVSVVAALLLCAALPAMAGERDGLQQQQGQQPCPAQGQQKNGQPGQQNQQNNANGSSNNQQNKNCNNNSQPAPLFGGALTIKKSSQSTDSTALGFNGLDPNGQVQSAFLNSSPSSDSEQKAQAMTNYRPTLLDLAVFQKTGGLTQASPTTN
jgi:hypothetical protein